MASQWLVVVCLLGGLTVHASLPRQLDPGEDDHSPGPCFDESLVREPDYVDQDVMASSPDASVKQDTTSSGGEASEKPASLRRLLERGSSVWCHGDQHTDRLCRFHNLCYVPQHGDFVFLHAAHSVMSGVPRDRFSPALLDLSSVRDHNGQYFHFADMPVVRATTMDIFIVETQALIMNRFHPDNLMHVLHDDLLPLHATLQMLRGNESRSTQLVFMEGWDPGDYAELYHVFSDLPPLYKQDLDATTLTTCFADVHVGVSKATTWYQYGFSEPQAPLPHVTITAAEIRHFTGFLSERMQIEQRPPREDYVVLLSRRQNRLIINEVELSVSLARRLGRNVVSLATETHSLVEMVRVISRAAGLIGMHGSLLTLAMFLPPGAILVELFPYAVPPEHYTPYRTLAGLPGMRIAYRAWRNTHPHHSRMHPGRAWHEGGITHLPPRLQREIEASEEVPRHLCCRNPHWLYRIYQDTVVDVDELLDVMTSVLTERRDDATLTHGIHPGAVRGLTCAPLRRGQDSLRVAWRPPWNMENAAPRQSTHFHGADSRCSNVAGSCRNLNNPAENTCDTSDCTHSTHSHNGPRYDGSAIDPPTNSNINKFGTLDNEYNHNSDSYSDFYFNIHSHIDNLNSDTPEYNSDEMTFDPHPSLGHDPDIALDTKKSGIDSNRGTPVPVLNYEVWLQEAGSDQYMAWLLATASYTFTAGLKPQTVYHVWVRAITVHGEQGPFNSEPGVCQTL